MLILGTDVWADGAEEAALRFVEALGVPTITNGMGRGVVPGGHPLLVTKARGAGARRRRPGRRGRHARSTSGSATASSAARTRRHARRRSCTSPTPPARSPATPTSPPRSSGDLTAVFDGLQAGARAAARQPDWSAWVADLQDTVARPPSADAELLGAEADPIHPARIYGELVPRLADDAVVIGDGGDFVSFAGKFVEPKRPGGWLDPGPYGCLGAGLGAAIAARLARPSAQVVLLLGDGAAGFSLMDVDTLVRHDLPVVMVMGNNSAWGLEKGPMQMLYGYDVVADLAPADAVRRGGEGARRRRRDRHRPAADRPGARPRLRLGRALPRQRDHRRRRGLPAHHLRDLIGGCGCGGPAARTYAAVGEVTVAAYADFTRGRRGPLRRAPARRRAPATARPSCGSRADDGERARHGHLLPGGLAVARDRPADDEGEFRMLAVAPGRAARGVGAALVAPGRGPVPRARRARRSCCPAWPRWPRAPALRAARLRARAGARLVPGARRRPDRLRQGAPMTGPDRHPDASPSPTTTPPPRSARGSLPVLGTPRLLAWCEAATCAAIDPTLAAARPASAPGSQLEHLARQPGRPGGRGDRRRGVRRRPAAPLHGRRPPHRRRASCVGTGEVTRVVVDAERFLARL